MPIVLDLETVPDEATRLLNFRRYLSKPYDGLCSALAELQESPSLKKCEEVAKETEALSKVASLDPMMARIVAIGMIYKRKGGKELVEIALSNQSEKNLLKEFWDLISEEEIPGETITYNGVSFDLPMLAFRSMVHGIQTSSWPGLMSIPKYRVWPHFDVMQHLTFWGRNVWRSLDHMAYCFGYPVEPDTGPDTGANVSKWYSVGAIDMIKQHTLEDCRKTYFLYKKMKDYYPKPTRARGRDGSPY